jgi:hypothetical protein
MIAPINVLQLDPVFKRALVIAEVQTTRRAHSANDSLHMASSLIGAAKRAKNRRTPLKIDFIGFLNAPSVTPKQIDDHQITHRTQNKSEDSEPEQR